MFVQHFIYDKYLNTGDIFEYLSRAGPAIFFKKNYKIIMVNAFFKNHKLI